MIIRHRGTPLFWLPALLFATASAQPDSNCHIAIRDKQYDLSPLSGDQTVSRSRSSPPTNMIDTLRFNICNELSPLEGVDSSEQCSSGTWACLSKINIKQGEPDRVIAVISMAQESELQAEYTPLSSPRGIKMTLHGSSYPSSITLDPVPQMFVLNLLCATETTDPEFKSYDGTEVVVEWSAPSGCDIGMENPSEGGDDKPENETEAVGSGMGWFFLLLFLMFGGYFALGAYYNYTTYGATGVDLIPHRDFWREVPYMLRDVVSHLCSSFQSRHTSSRGGYISV